MSSQISNRDFAEAVRQSIERSGTFASVVRESEGGSSESDGDESRTADFLLDVVIQRLHQPMAGTDMTVDMKVAWTLTNLATGNEVWDEVIRSSHTATVGAEFVGICRLQLANEGAARENIRKGLKAIPRVGGSSRFRR